MANEHELLGKPLVSLEAGKLLGMRQIAKVSAGSSDDASRDGADGAAVSRVEMSRTLSKIGTETTELNDGGKLLSRMEMSRMLSKSGGEDPVGPAADASTENRGI